jgi:hypothetical protein
MLEVYVLKHKTLIKLFTKTYDKGSYLASMFSNVKARQMHKNAMARPDKCFFFQKSCEVHLSAVYRAEQSRPSSPCRLTCCAEALSSTRIIL